MDIKIELTEIAALIIQLLGSSSLTKSTDARLLEQTLALQGIAGNSSQSVLGLLYDVHTDAPLTFDKIWPSTAKALKNYGNDPTAALRRLGLLLGWAYIESVWNAQTTGRQNASLSGSYFAKLAAIQMGLPHDLDERDVITAIYTHSTLMSSLLLSRFEQGVKGGLEQINGMEDRLSGWESRLDETEERTTAAESKISAYNKTLEEYEVAFGFLGMAAAYKKFFERKTSERNLFGVALILFFVVIVATPFAAYHFINASDSASLAAFDNRQAATSDGAAIPDKAAKADKGATLEKKPVASAHEFSMWQLLKYAPYVAFLLLLIYFFRVVLLHFNSTQAQLLQLEIKLATLGFIQDYVTFLKQNGSPDLSKFESLIFGGIVADLNNVPSTFDGLEQLAKTVTQLRGGGDR